MDFKDIAAVAGKGGLYIILKPTKTGVILESLDGNKTKLVASVHNKVSVLDEISIYTTDQEGTVQLSDVMKKIYNEFGDDPGVDKSSDGDELKSFLAHIIPAYDVDRVYVSDIKKLVTWYNIMLSNAPELLQATADETDTTSEEAS